MSFGSRRTDGRLDASFPFHGTVRVAEEEDVAATIDVTGLANPAAPLAVLILGDGMSGKTHALRAVEVHTHSTTFGM